MVRRAPVALLLVGAALLLISLPGDAFCWDETSHVPGQICLVLEGDGLIEGVLARYGIVLIEGEPDEGLFLVTCPRGVSPEEFAAILAGDPEVEIAEPNYRIEMPEAIRQMVMGAIGGEWADYEDQAMAERIGLDAAHAIGRGAGVVVAVLDTGIDPGHPAFEGRLSDDGLDVIDQDQDPWETANGVDDDRDGWVDEGFGHGTMVAGIIALVAPDAQILPVRVLDDEGRGTSFDIARGMIHATVRGADLLNLSFGCPQWVKIIDRRLRTCGVHDVISVTGAGNRDLEEPAFYPGYDDRAIMVTAVDSLDIKAGFADFHAAVDVSAPGVGIRSAWPGAEWGLGDGCSFAVPIVTGGLALLLSDQPVRERETVGLWLSQGVEPIDGLPGNAAYAGKLGSGRIDLVRLLRAPASVPAVPAITAHRVLRLTAWPNPSRGGVSLWLDRAAAGVLPDLDRSGGQVRILDAAGRQVRVLDRSASSSWSWDARDERGHPVPAGAYFARLDQTGATCAAPIVIIR